MIYNHRVKRNGVYYEAGQDVPEDIISEKVEESSMSETSDLGAEPDAPKRGRPKKTE